MSDIARIRFLLEKFLREECSPEERDELFVLLEEASDEEGVELSGPMQELWHKAKAGELPSTADRVDWTAMYQRIAGMPAEDELPDIVEPRDHAGRPGRLPVVRKMRAAWLVAAAVFIGCIITGGALLWNKPRQGSVRAAVVTRSAHDVAPGGNKAILTLANGSQIVLDSVATGEVIRQAGTKVVKTGDGRLAYEAAAGDAVVYNTITIPRAAKYQLVLPDGSKVWLNSASSLRFPSAFRGKDREVELTGEAYFEVAENKDKPFRVKVIHPLAADGDLAVEVLGTHFDVMAYPDEDALQTTLLQGSVRVSMGGGSVLVSPGRQAQVSRGNGSMQVVEANVNQAVAWTKGYFYFDRSDVRHIMRQVSRWYDLNIVYEAPPPVRAFSGKIERSLPLSGVTTLLEAGHLHFRIEGKDLIMMK